MSYEYKDTIQDSIIHYYDHVLLYREYTDDVLDELDHVYAKATEVDECKAKTKAYDRVTEKLYARIDHIIMTSPPEQCKPGYVDGLYNALDIINSELESGESE